MSASDSLGRQFFHGSPHRIDVGDTVRPGVHRYYDASLPDRVHMTTDPDDARQWGEDAHEMTGRTKGWVYVHTVEPIGPVQTHKHQDGVDHVTPEARVVARRRYPKRM